MAAKKRSSNAPSSFQASITLSAEHAADLIALARYYRTSMGIGRYLVRFGSGREMRARYRFVEDESKVLEAFAESVVQRLEGSNEPVGTVQMTPRALIAFWGRALSSLESTRSRRKLSPARLEVREAVEQQLRSAAAELLQQDRSRTLAEIHTRREREVAWMRERLQLPAAE
jgi:hypothetical protein